jgi:hypothetical protein
MNKNIIEQAYIDFFNYCFEGDIESARICYYTYSPNIRLKNDKIFRFCCDASQEMYGYSERFTEHSKKLINIIKFLSIICPYYEIKIFNDKLIEWKINNKIIITI